MSHGYNQKSKRHRRMLDLVNPERAPLRNKIRRGIVPRYSLHKLPKFIYRWTKPTKEKQSVLKKYKHGIEYKAISVFAAMTYEDTKKAFLKVLEDRKKLRNQLLGRE
jgi:hypothetical protein